TAMAPLTPRRQRRPADEHAAESPRVENRHRPDGAVQPPGAGGAAARHPARFHGVHAHRRDPVRCRGCPADRCDPGRSESERALLARTSAIGLLFERRSSAYHAAQLSARLHVCGSGREPGMSWRWRWTALAVGVLSVGTIIGVLLVLPAS